MPIVNRWETIDRRAALQKDAGYVLRGQMSNPDYLKFLNEKLLHPFVLIELTSKCNFSCFYCNSKNSVRPKGFMDENLFYHIVDQLKSISAYAVALHVDGEPTLHPKFEEFVSYLNSKSIPVSLATNASLLNESFLNLRFDLCTYISASAEELKERCAIDFGTYTKRLANYLKKWWESDAPQNLSLHLYHEAGLGYSSPQLQAKKKYVAELLEQAGFTGVVLRDNACHFFSCRKPNGHQLSFSFTPIVTGGLFPGGKNAQPGGRIPASCGFCDSAWQRMTIFWDGSIGLCCHGLQGETIYTSPGEIWEKPLAWLWLEHPNVKLFRDAMANGRLVLKGCMKCLTRYPNHEFYVQGARFVPRSDVALGVDQHIDPTYKTNTLAIFGFVTATANGIVWSVGRRSQFGFRLPGADPGDYILEIDAVAFAPREMGEDQQLSLVVNGLKVASLKLEHNELKTYRANFAMGKNSDGALVTLEFQERKSAFELGIGKDMRRLGLGIARFRVLPGGVSESRGVEPEERRPLPVF